MSFTDNSWGELYVFYKVKIHKIKGQTRSKIDNFLFKFRGVIFTKFCIKYFR